MKYSLSPAGTTCSLSSSSSSSSLSDQSNCPSMIFSDSQSSQSFSDSSDSSVPTSPTSESGKGHDHVDSPRGPSAIQDIPTRHTVGIHKQTSCKNEEDQDDTPRLSAPRQFLLDHMGRSIESDSKDHHRQTGTVHGPANDPASVAHRAQHYSRTSPEDPGSHTTLLSGTSSAGARATKCSQDRAVVGLGLGIPTPDCLQESRTRGPRRPEVHGAPQRSAQTRFFSTPKAPLSSNLHGNLNSFIATDYPQLTKGLQGNSSRSYIHHDVNSPPISTSISLDNFAFASDAFVLIAEQANKHHARRSVSCMFA